VSHGWPYYAEELWLATPDNGLCASLYAASEVSAKVGDRDEVKITEEDRLSISGHGQVHDRNSEDGEISSLSASAAMVPIRLRHHQRKRRLARKASR